MQIALQDLRRLGIRKIVHTFDWDTFIVELKALDVELRGYKSAPFIVPKKWCTFDKDSLKQYSGILKFMKVAEPTIDYDTCTEVTQRKFRNMWVRFSLAIARDINCSEFEEALIRDIGIKLIYHVGYGNQVDSNIIDIYNALIKWYLFTLQETNFENKKITVIEVLEYLSLYNDKDFVDFINIDL